jgi:hypothetical protein
MRASERWQSGRMRIIANDVSLETGTGGSNPPLSVQNLSPSQFLTLSVLRGRFLLQMAAG